MNALKFYLLTVTLHIFTMKNTLLVYDLTNALYLCFNDADRALEP